MADLFEPDVELRWRDKWASGWGGDLRRGGGEGRGGGDLDALRTGVDPGHRRVWGVGIASPQIFDAPDGPTVLGNSLIVDNVEQAKVGVDTVRVGRCRNGRRAFSSRGAATNQWGMGYLMLLPVER